MWNDGTNNNEVDLSQTWKEVEYMLCEQSFVHEYD